MPRPSAVVVVGLGEEGRLRSSDLSAHRAPGRAGLCAARGRERERRRHRLRAGGHADRQRRRRRPRRQRGAGHRAGRGRGQPAAARQRLAGGDAAAPGRAVPRPRHRAHSARWRVLADSRPSDFALPPTHRSPASARCAAGSIRATAAPTTTSSPRCSACDEHRAAAASSTRSTRSARAPRCAARRRRPSWCDELVRVGADSDNTDTQIGRTLFQLLVPVEIEPFLAGSQRDGAAARPATPRGFPWELLDTGDGRPTGAGARRALGGAHAGCCASCAPTGLPRPARGRRPRRTACW